MSTLSHLHEHCLSRNHSHDSTSSHCVSRYCLTLIVVFRLSASGRLLVSYAEKRWCSFKSMSAKPADRKTSALNTYVIKYSCPSDPLHVTVNGTGKKVLCDFPVCRALLCFGPLHGLQPSDPRTNQSSPEPCLRHSPIISATSVLFRCGVYLVGFRSISTPVQLLWSSSCCLHG